MLRIRTYVIWNQIIRLKILVFCWVLIFSSISASAGDPPSAADLIRIKPSLDQLEHFTKQYEDALEAGKKSGQLGAAEGFERQLEAYVKSIELRDQPTILRETVDKASQAVFKGKIERNLKVLQVAIKKGDLVEIHQAKLNLEEATKRIDWRRLDRGKLAADYTKYIGDRVATNYYRAKSAVGFKVDRHLKTYQRPKMSITRGIISKKQRRIIKNMFFGTLSDVKVALKDADKALKGYDPWKSVKGKGATIKTTFPKEKLGILSELRLTEARLVTRTSEVNVLMEEYEKALKKMSAKSPESIEKAEAARIKFGDALNGGVEKEGVRDFTEYRQARAELAKFLKENPEPKSAELQVHIDQVAQKGGLEGLKSTIIDLRTELYGREIGMTSGKMAKRKYPIFEELRVGDLGAKQRKLDEKFKKKFEKINESHFGSVTDDIHKPIESELNSNGEGGSLKTIQEDRASLGESPSDTQSMIESEASEEDRAQLMHDEGDPNSTQEPKSPQNEHAELQDQTRHPASEGQLPQLSSTRNGSEISQLLKEAQSGRMLTQEQLLQKIKQLDRLAEMEVNLARRSEIETARNLFSTNLARVRSQVPQSNRYENQLHSDAQAFRPDYHQTSKVKDSGSSDGLGTTMLIGAGAVGVGAIAIHGLNQNSKSQSSQNPPPQAGLKSLDESSSVPEPSEIPNDSDQPKN